MNKLNCVVNVVIMVLLAGVAYMGRDAYVRIESEIARLRTDVFTMPQDVKDRIVASGAATIARSMQTIEEMNRQSCDSCYKNIRAGFDKMNEDVKTLHGKSCGEIESQMSSLTARSGTDLTALVEKHDKTCAAVSEQVLQLAARVSADSTNTFARVVEDSARTLQGVVAVHERAADMRKTKVAEYLKAAELDGVDVEAKALLYRLAIQNSDVKSPILAKYSGLEEDVIKSMLKVGDVSGAESRYDRLARYFDAVVAHGAPSDIMAIDSLKTLLSGIHGSIVDAKRAQSATEVAQVSELETRVGDVTNHAAGVLLLKDVDALVVSEVMDDRKEELRNTIKRKMCCMTAARDELELPERVDEKTPWSEWLENFRKRIEDPGRSYSDIVKDLSAAEEVLGVAKELNRPDLTNVLSKIDCAANVAAMKDWLARADKAVAEIGRTREKKSAVRCVELLDEIGEYTDENRALCEGRIVDLNKIIVETALREVSRQAERVRGLKSKIPDDEYVQMVASIEGQCLQSLIRLQELNEEYDGKFLSLIDSVCGAVDGCSSVMAGIRKSKESQVESGVRDRDRRFVAWAQKTIDEAVADYEAGEKKAKEWFATTSNQEAQRMYSAAWHKIVKVNSGDLAAVDELLYRRWQEQKAKIENRYTPKEQDLKYATYVGREDFK